MSAEQKSLGFNTFDIKEKAVVLAVFFFSEVRQLVSVCWRVVGASLRLPLPAVAWQGHAVSS